MAELAQLIGAIGRQTIELGGDNYVFDPKKNIWMNEETKEPADPFIQKIIKDTYKKIETGRSVASLNVRNVAKSYGIVGSATIRKSNPKALVAANNDEPILPQELAINKPLVKMINVLASIDGFLKQRLENQRVIGRNNQLAARENQIEQKDTRPQIDIIKSDAEKVEGSNLGLYAIGGLALLTLDPVQEALKDIVNGVVTMGGFVTDVAKSINGVFKFLLGGSTSSSDTIPDVQPDTSGVSTTPAPESNQGQGAVATPAQTQTSQATPEKKSSFLTDVGSAALTGATIGSVVPRVGGAAGAIVGAAIGAITHFTGGGSAASESTSSSDAVGGSVTPVTPGAAGAAEAAATQIGKTGREIGGYLSGGGVALNAAQDQWCAAFVNSSLARGGIKGAGNVANSFQNWGTQIDPNQVQKGDVVLQTRGKGPGQVGGHVGIATGQTVNGKIEMIAGNSGAGGSAASRSVKKYFVPINGNLQVRRNDPNAQDAPQGTGEVLASAVKEAASSSLEAVAKLFGVLGGAIVKPGIAKTDFSSVIANAAKETNADIAVAKTPKQPALPPAPAPPNINKIDGGATQNPATAQDKNSVYYYLRRFGYQELSVPEKTLKIA